MFFFTFKKSTHSAYRIPAGSANDYTHANFQWANVCVMSDECLMSAISIESIKKLVLIELRLPYHTFHTSFGILSYLSMWKATS